MFKMFCVLACALCGGRVGTALLCILLVFISDKYLTFNVIYCHHTILCSESTEVT